MIEVTDEGWPPLYKVVGPNGEPLNGGSGNWPLPSADAPGEWRIVTGPLVACSNGLHLATAEQLSHWLPPRDTPAVIYRAEVEGELWVANGKYVARKVRLLPRKRPTPVDFAGYQAKRQAIQTRAERACARADKALRKAVELGWLAYARATGDWVLKFAPAGTREALVKCSEARRRSEVAQSRAMARLRKVYEPTMPD